MTSLEGVPERGARRRKLAGYLKAANEFRQTYQQSLTARGQDINAEADEDGASIPGAFPDVSIVRHGDEEMVLFPSYARKHVKQKRGSYPHPMPVTSEDIRNSSGPGNAEYWRREWDRYEDENALVDVDVRGWIYSPHRGPMTRKNRMLVSLARHLSGIPAPSTGSRGNSRSTSPHAIHRNQREEELVEKEAESIMKRGEDEANVAWHGGYSESNGNESDRASLYSTKRDSRPSSPEKDIAGRSGEDSSFVLGGITKRPSWNQPADMSPAELAIANTHLMNRLKPFLTNPLVSAPLTVFFYNDTTSKSRTVTTNEAGHFNLRAALDFLPTNVRVLASENLSATEEIDDTIKHSAIGSGAKEIFRNTFVRDLGDLTIEGVKEWYNNMAKMGVKLHYVSNSPWQLFPVLVSFFAGAGLPPGSFHLKQYSGMLQGIFEPVAERKKATLERIVSDFPERRFILVGDSGEADLELYTDIVIANPRRVLGVFIRDVTTADGSGFFDSSIGPLKGDRGYQSLSRSGGSSGSTSPKETGIERPQRPRSPSKQKTEPTVERARPKMGTLIDIDDGENESTRPNSNTKNSEGNDHVDSSDSSKNSRPSRPIKPMALRSVSGENQAQGTALSVASRKIPVPPTKPIKNSTSPEVGRSQPSPLSQTQTVSPPNSRATSLERQGHRSTVRDKVALAYNALPSPAAYWYGPSQNQQSSTFRSRQEDASRTASASTGYKPAPPLPPRRGLTSYPAAAAHYATNRLSGGWNGYNTDGAGDSNGNPSSPVNKKEELWKRRWARARHIMKEQGVLLRSWRRGGDVMEDAIRLVERANKEDGRDKKPG